MYTYTHTYIRFSSEMQFSITTSECTNEYSNPIRQFLSELNPDALAHGKIHSHDYGTVVLSVLDPNVIEPPALPKVTYYVTTKLNNILC